jgi:AcrR family transcriptional regulator
MSQPLHPSKQNRSRETQARILQATARLLGKEPFESISVRRIVIEAETSIGSFYARFRDKNALLSVLYAEYEMQLHERLVRLQESTADARSLEEVAQLIGEHFVDMYGEVPNLSRALYEYATRSPKTSEAKTLAVRRRKQYSFLLDALLSFRAEITHSDPVRAVDLGLYFVVVACRNRLLYPLAPQTRTLRISKMELKKELVRLLTGYLRD